MDSQNEICYDPSVFIVKKNNRKRDRFMGDIFSVILVAIMVVLGGVPSLYILISMPLLIAKKIYRKVKFGNSLYD